LPKKVGLKDVSGWLSPHNPGEPTELRTHSWAHYSAHRHGNEKAHSCSPCSFL